jgi:SOS-response transcriptional repressor LexA
MHGKNCLLPRWAKRIADLRKKMGLSQQKFGAALGRTAMAVSHWENADNPPSAEVFTKLSHLARAEADKLFFVRCAANVTPGLLHSMESVARKYDIIPQQHFDLALPEWQTAVPLYRDARAAGEPRLARSDDVEEMLNLPVSWVPHPESTKCIRMAGNSMSPIIEEGHILAFEVLYEDSKTPLGEMVAVRTPDGAVTARWLRKSGTEIILVTQQNSQEYPPIILEQEPGWKVIGKVLWWLGKPSKQ